jgi:hypothetical protein
MLEIRAYYTAKRKVEARKLGRWPRYRLMYRRLDAAIWSVG